MLTAQIKLKTCPKCQQPHIGTQARCKACYAQWAREWRMNNPTAARRIVQRYQRLHPERIKANNRNQNLRRYGLTDGDYKQILDDQNGCCAICGTHQPSGAKGKFFFVDHCHKTNGIRGLLCLYCNSMIGYALDNPTRLRRAAEYLERANQIVR